MISLDTISSSMSWNFDKEEEEEEETLKIPKLRGEFQ